MFRTIRQLLRGATGNTPNLVQPENIDELLLSKLPDICGVAFVRKSYFKNGIAIAHEGVLIDNMELIHASSEQQKTVKVNLIDYINNNGSPRFDGIMFYRFYSQG